MHRQCRRRGAAVSGECHCSPGQGRRRGAWDACEMRTCSPPNHAVARLRRPSAALPAGARGRAAQRGLLCTPKNSFTRRVRAVRPSRQMAPACLSCRTVVGRGVDFCRPPLALLPRCHADARRSPSPLAPGAAAIAGLRCAVRVPGEIPANQAHRQRRIRGRVVSIG
eukprot:363570-Chlamydomonas_euryale.AAC.16